MTRAHKLCVLILIVCLFSGIGLLACAMEEDARIEEKVEEVEEYTQMECTFLGDAAKDATWRYAGVYYCKHIEQKRCFYVVVASEAVALNIAPCFAEGSMVEEEKDRAWGE